MDDVCVWLQSIKLSQCAPIFREHDVDGGVLVELKPGALSIMGMDELQQAKFQAGLKKLHGVCACVCV